jgi:hypothetical protein
VAPAHYKGDWEAKGSTEIFNEHHLSLPSLDSMLWESHKDKLSICDLGGYNYFSFPNEENKSKKVSNLPIITQPVSGRAGI